MMSLVDQNVNAKDARILRKGTKEKRKGEENLKQGKSQCNKETIIRREHLNSSQ